VASSVGDTFFSLAKSGENRGEELERGELTGRLLLLLLLTVSCELELSNELFG
jgi:hypothetical protein